MYSSLSRITVTDPLSAGLMIMFVSFLSCCNGLNSDFYRLGFSFNIFKDLISDSISVIFSFTAPRIWLSGGDQVDFFLNLGICLNLLRKSSWNNGISGNYVTCYRIHMCIVDRIGRHLFCLFR